MKKTKKVVEIGRRPQAVLPPPAFLFVVSSWREALVVENEFQREHAFRTTEERREGVEGEGDRKEACGRPSPSLRLSPFLRWPKAPWLKMSYRLNPPPSNPEGPWFKIDD